MKKLLLLVPIILAAIGCGPSWNESFDNYPNGQNLHGVNGWAGFDNNASASAFVTNQTSVSSSNSIFIAGSSNIVRQLNGSSNRYHFSTKQFVPSTSTGATYLSLMSRYAPGISNPKSFSLTLQATTADQTIRSVLRNPNGPSTKLLMNQWVPIDVVIDLGADSMQVYYNKILLVVEPWRTPGDSFALPLIQAVVLRSGNPGSQAYYDNLVLTPQAVSPLDVTQDVFRYENVLYDQTNWGNVEVNYLGQGNFQYFNLTVDGNWVVQNVPLINHEGLNRLHTVNFDFPFASVRSSARRSGGYGYSVTSSIVNSPPSQTMTYDAYDRLITHNTGFLFETTPAPLPAVVNTKASPVTSEVGHLGFPNQPCGPGECVPTALSNSLQWLKQKNGLDIPDNKIDIDALKGATGWGPSGVNGQRDAADAWWKKKDDYCKAQGFPIKTTTTTSLQEIFDAVEKGCDVELRVPGHAAAIVGAAKQQNGDYDIDVAHDTGQRNNADDCKKQRVKWHHDTGVLTGGQWIDGKTFDYAVIECYVPPGKPTKVSTDKGTTFSGNQQSLDESDDHYWKLFNDDDLIGSLGIESFSNLASPSSLVMHFEGAVSRTGLQMEVFMLNYQTSTYETIYSDEAMLDDTAYTMPVGGDLSRFISEGRDMRAQVVWMPINDEVPAQDGWLHRADFAGWDIVL